MAANLTCLCGEGEDLPGVEHDAHVGMADTGMRPSKILALDPVDLRTQELHENEESWTRERVSSGTYKLINTSPAPGSGTSNSSIFVEIEPGLS